MCAWAAKKIDRPVKWTADRTESFLSDAHGRDHVTHAELALDVERQDHRAARAHDRQPRRLSVDVLRRWCRPILYAPLLSGQYAIPNIYAEVDGVYTTTAPVDAYRGAGRPEATFVVERLVEVAARETGRDPAEFRRHELRHVVPASDAGHHDLRRRGLRGGARQGAGARRLQGRRRAQGGLGRQGQAARRRLLRLYRGLRPRRRRARSPRWAEASEAGNRPKSASIRSARSKC